MKKQVLFSLCLTATTAVFVTGCATKQSATASAEQQEAIEVAQQEEQLIQDDVNVEPVDPVVTPAEPAPAPEQQPAVTEAAPVQEAPRQELKKPVHPKPEVYTVTSGDSISALSARFNVRKADILALNPSLRSNPNNLRIGQKVNLPAGTKVDTPAKPRAKVVTPKGATTYTVKSGDVLGGIANRHGVTVAAIKSANNLKGDIIWVGQKLIIPGAKKATKTTQTAKPTQKKVEKKPAAPKAEPKKPVETTPVVEPAPAPAPVAEPVVEPALPEEPAPAPVVEQNEAPALDPVPPAPEAAPAPAPVQTRAYVVAPGEDLVGVSLKWGVSLPILRALNNLDEAQGNAIAPGTTLQIPVMQE